MSLSPGNNKTNTKWNVFITSSLFWSHAQKKKIHQLNLCYIISLHVQVFLRSKKKCWHYTTSVPHSFLLLFKIFFSLLIKIEVDLGTSLSQRLNKKAFHTNIFFFISFFHTVKIHCKLSRDQILLKKMYTQEFCVHKQGKKHGVTS